MSVLSFKPFDDDYYDDETVQVNFKIFMLATLNTKIFNI